MYDVLMIIFCLIVIIGGVGFIIWLISKTKGLIKAVPDVNWDKIEEYIEEDHEIQFKETEEDNISK